MVIVLWVTVIPPTAEMTELTTLIFAPSSLAQAVVDRAVTTTLPLLTPLPSLRPLVGMMAQEDTTKNN
jgi:hypothetical protein